MCLVVTKCRWIYKYSEAEHLSSWKSFPSHAAIPSTSIGGYRLSMGSAHSISSRHINCILIPIWNVLTSFLHMIQAVLVILGYRGSHKKPAKFFLRLFFGDHDRIWENKCGSWFFISIPTSARITCKGRKTVFTLYSKGSKREKPLKLVNVRCEVLQALPSYIRCPGTTSMGKVSRPKSVASRTYRQHHCRGCCVHQD